MESLKISKECYCKLLSDTLRHYNRYFKETVAPYSHKGGREFNNDHYPFIPSNSILETVAVLDSLLLSIKRATKTEYVPKFIDCGCGVGNIVLLAKELGYSSHGIEYDCKTYNIAKKLVPPDCRIIRGDITKFESYENYDVIYFYVPISNGHKMDTFVRKVVDEAKIGSYVLSYGYSSRILCSKKFKPVPTKIVGNVKDLYYTGHMSIYKRI